MNKLREWALVTGASSGIGYELARLFAAARFDLVLVARNEARLNKLAEELRAAHGIETRVLVRDLAAPDAALQIFNALPDTPVSILVNNAGFGLYGPFVESDLQAQAEMMQVNMTALVQLTHFFVKPMLARRSGKILNVASTAAFQPGPFINVYYASKAFVHSFSYALAEELHGTGITVTALCPGTTQTEFFRRGKFGPTRAPFTMDARVVAEAGYRGLMQGKRVVIPGMMNKIMTFLSRRMPTSLPAGVIRRLYKK